MDSRFITAAFSGTTTDRNTIISSRIEAARIAPMNSGRVSVSCLSRSRVSAVAPVTYTPSGVMERTRSSVCTVAGSDGSVVGSVGSTTVSPFAADLRLADLRDAGVGGDARRPARGCPRLPSPVPCRSATTSSGALKPGPKPSASRSYALRSVWPVGLSPASGKPVLSDSAGAASVEEDQRRRRPGTARAGRRSGGPAATRRWPRRAWRRDAGRRSGPRRCGRRAATGSPAAG